MKQLISNEGIIPSEMANYVRLPIYTFILTVFFCPFLSSDRKGLNEVGL